MGFYDHRAIHFYGKFCIKYNIVKPGGSEQNYKSNEESRNT